MIATLRDIASFVFARDLATPRTVLLLTTDFDGHGGIAQYSRMLAQSCPDCRVVSVWELGVHRSKREVLCSAWRESHGVSAILCAHVSLAPLAWLLSKARRCPYVVVGHGIEVWNALPRIVEETLRRATRVVAVSHFTKRMLISEHQVNAKKIHVIHPCVEPWLLEEARKFRRTLPA